VSVSLAWNVLGAGAGVGFAQVILGFNWHGHLHLSYFFGGGSINVPPGGEAYSVASAPLPNVPAHLPFDSVTFAVKNVFVVGLTPVTISFISRGTQVYKKTVSSQAAGLLVGSVEVGGPLQVLNAAVFRSQGGSMRQRAAIMVIIQQLGFDPAGHGFPSIEERLGDILAPWSS